MNQRSAFLLFLIGVIGTIAGLMVLPFIGYVLAAILLGFILYPANKRLRNRTTPSIAAGLLLLLTIIAAFVPLFLMVGFVGGDAARLAQNIQGQELPGFTEIEGMITEVTGQQINLEDRVKALVRTAAAYIAGSASDIIRLATNVAVGLSLMLFILFYVLRDGEAFVAWTRSFEVIPTPLQDRLYGRTAHTVWAVIKGHVLVAVLQGLIAGIGLIVVGVPNAFFWTFVMILLGFIPLIGTALVWVPAAGFLLVTGQIILAAGLFLYGVVVVGLTDNLARPLLVDEEAGVHEVFIILGVIGGTIVFGAIGLFIGPVIFGVFKELLDIYESSYDQL